MTGENTPSGPTAADLRARAILLQGVYDAYVGDRSRDDDPEDEPLTWANYGETQPFDEPPEPWLA